MGDVAIGPDAVTPLVAMHGAERHKILGAEIGHALGDLPADGGFTRRRWRDEDALFVVKIDHVGVTKSAQGKQERDRVVGHNALHSWAPDATLPGIIDVDDEAILHRNQKNAILIVVGDTQDLDAIG